MLSKLNTVKNSVWLGWRNADDFIVGASVVVMLSVAAGRAINKQV